MKPPIRSAPDVSKHLHIHDHYDAAQASEFRGEEKENCGIGGTNGKLPAVFRLFRHFRQFRNPLISFDIGIRLSQNRTPH